MYRRHLKSRKIISLFVFQPHSHCKLCLDLSVVRLDDASYLNVMPQTTRITIQWYLTGMHTRDGPPCESKRAPMFLTSKDIHIRRQRLCRKSNPPGGLGAVARPQIGVQTLQLVIPIRHNISCISEVNNRILSVLGGLDPLKYLCTSMLPGVIPGPGVRLFFARCRLRDFALPDSVAICCGT